MMVGYTDASICPVCKRSSSIKRTWRAGYQYACEDCSVLFNIFGGGMMLAPRII
jgi:predicted  nucleic acid-binding Zn ribbon protein